MYKSKLRNISAARRVAVLTGLLVVTVVTSQSAFAYLCQGKVESVTVSPSGVVALNAPDAGISFGYLCILGATENGVSAETCKGILGTLLTAASTGRPVQMGFNDSSSCGARAAWAWVTGWYWGPMLVAE